MKNSKKIFAAFLTIVFTLLVLVASASTGQNKGQKRFMKTCKSKGYKASKQVNINHKGSKSKKSVQSKAIRTFHKGSNDLQELGKVENIFTVDFLQNNIA